MGSNSFFFKISKYKRFTFNPRYYDERKERREELIKQLDEEARFKNEGVAYNYRPRLTKGYLQNYKRQLNRKENPTSTIRLIIILMVLIAIVYWILH